MRKKKQKILHNMSASSTVATIFKTSSKKIAEEIAQQFNKKPKDNNRKRAKTL